VTQRRSNPLHLALLFTAWLGQLPWPITPALTLLAALAVRALGLGWPLALWLAAWSLADWALLTALPRLGLSYGRVQPSHLALLVARTLLALADLAWAPLAWAGQPLLFTLALYGLAIEPFRLGVTELTLTDPYAGQDARPLSILQIGDIHIERLTKRERQVLEIVDRLQPDLILLTGDYLNLSYVGEERAIQDLRAFLGRLHARSGVYAVRGTQQVDVPKLMPRLFAGLPITVLEGKRADLEIEGRRLCLLGVGCNRDLVGDREVLLGLVRRPSFDPGNEADAGIESRPTDVHPYTILLYHMPDLLDAAAEAGVDLYLAGHTHGGQIRLPLYGALITASQFGKRFEMGWYEKGPTRLYLSRGVGLEGMGAPRARFLAPPEIVHITLK
jgi:uncharacterized protein